MIPTTITNAIASIKNSIATLAANLSGTATLAELSSLATDLQTCADALTSLANPPADVTPATVTIGATSTQPATTP